MVHVEQTQQPQMFTFTLPDTQFALSPLKLAIFKATVTMQYSIAWHDQTIVFLLPTSFDCTRSLVLMKIKKKFCLHNEQLLPSKIST